MSTPDVMVHAMRVGVFSKISAADRAVERLLEAGFTPDQITLVCSGETHENFFKEYGDSTQNSAGKGEVTSGATLGATIGGLSAIALGAATGAVPLVIAGIAGASGGSAMGGFVGLMSSKGVERDFLNSCHEQVLAGKLLVSAEDHGEDAETKLAVAQRIFIEEGSEFNKLAQP